MWRVWFSLAPCYLAHCRYLTVPVTVFSVVFVVYETVSSIGPVMFVQRNRVLSFTHRALSAAHPTAVSEGVSNVIAVALSATWAWHVTLVAKVLAVT